MVLFKWCAYNSDIDRIIWCIYKTFLLFLKMHSTSHLKTNWEKEGGITISEEERKIMWRNQWKCTSLQKWIEFSCKEFSNTSICWKNCGNQNIFRDYPANLDFWIHNALQDICKCVMPLESKTFKYLQHDWEKQILNEYTVGGY